MRYGLPFGTAVAPFFALAQDHRTHPVSGKTSLVGGAGPHGSSRVPTGFHGRFFQEVFPIANRLFFAFSGAFLRGKSIETAGSNNRIPEIEKQLPTFNFRCLDFNFQLSEDTLRLPTFQFPSFQFPLRTSFVSTLKATGPRPPRAPKGFLGAPRRPPKRLNPHR